MKGLHPWLRRHKPRLQALIFVTILAASALLYPAAMRGWDPLVVTLLLIIGAAMILAMLLP
jgi:hypothetical protein